MIEFDEILQDIVEHYTNCNNEYCEVCLCRHLLDTVETKDGNKMLCGILTQIAQEVLEKEKKNND